MEKILSGSLLAGLILVIVIAFSFPINGQIIETGTTDAPVEEDDCTEPICPGGEDPYFTGEYESNGCKVMRCPEEEDDCTEPICPGGEEPYFTDQYDADGCKIFKCTLIVEPFEDCNIDFREDGNLKKYLGSNIYPQKESDWMNYQPIIDKVNEITVGLTTDREKAIAISNWVKTSRPYCDECADTFGGEGSKSTYANQLFSIIDIFDADTGVCFDSAMINVAMLRLAGIPARIAIPTFSVSGQVHARTNAYIDGSWVYIDSTFGEGEAKFDITDFPHLVESYFKEMKTDPILFTDYLNLEENHSLSPKVFQAYQSFEDSQIFGDLTLGIIPHNEKIYPQDALADEQGGFPIFFKIIRIDGKDLYFAVNETKLEYVISSTKPPDREFEECEVVDGQTVCTWRLISYTEVSVLEKLMPRFHFLNQYEQPVQLIVGPRFNYVLELGGHYRYLSTMKLPLGEYRLTYYANMIPPGGYMSEDVDLAYADFKIKKGETARLTYDLFQKSAGVDQGYFDAIIDRIKGTWAKCEEQPSSTASKTTPIKEECIGCTDFDNCIPFNTRKEGKYCDLDKTMKEQKTEDNPCDNNYECKSNLCINHKCLSGNLFDKVLNWFKNIFG